MNRILSSVASLSEKKMFYFDEFRTNLQQASISIDDKIKSLKQKDDDGDQVAKILLYLYRGIFSIIEGEKKYRQGDYIGASLEYIEGGKMLTRFQRMSTGFSLEFQQEAERMDLFSKGRNAECIALKKGTSHEDQTAALMEAANSYTLEGKIVENNNNPLLKYNAKARENFTKGLHLKFQGEQAFDGKNLRLAKKRNLGAYKSFVIATYYNPSYYIWVKEQNETLKIILRMIVEQKASVLWKEAFTLSSEGNFIDSSVKCNFASKLYRRASKLSIDGKNSKLFESYSFMLKSSMYEANANEFLKNLNDAKKATRQFELATDFLKQAIQAFPNKEEDKATVNRWEAQQEYYLGHFYQSQGIFKLDSENYQEALGMFTQGENAFEKALQKAKIVADKNLLELIQKSMTEAKGYIGMCKTVLD